MRKLLRASFLAGTAIALMFLSAPLVSYAAGTAQMEATILKDKIVPETEVTRITDSTTLCTTSGSESTSDADISCEETYPGKTRVNITGSTGKRVITIRDASNKLLTAETGVGATSVVRDADENKTAERPNPGVSDDCSSFACVVAKLPGMLFSGIAFLLLTISSFFLFMAGVVFNWVVIRTVFQFALYFGTSEGMLIAWGVLRDIGNIALLFGFIFMGIATILNTSNLEGYTARKALPQLIIFAVLLNFSLFASQAVIDVANGFSSVFATYAGQACDETVSGQGAGQEYKDCANNGISGQILSAVGMNQIIPTGDQGVSALTKAWDAPYTYSAMLILLSILVSITAVVLLAAAIMLAIRAVVLSLLMVTSPIGFAGMAIPALHGLAKDWWHKLINQAFFAPLYLLMLFLCLKLVENLKTGEATISDAIMGNTLAGQTFSGNMQVVMVFIIVIGFMIAALMIAQKMGAYGAGFATNAASAVVYGGMARTANLLSGGAGGALRWAAMKGLKPGEKPGSTRIALMNTGRTLRSANLDMRRIAPVTAALKMGGASAGTKPAEHATYNEMAHQVGDLASFKSFREASAQGAKEIALAQLDRNAHHSDDGSLVKEDKEILQNMSLKQLEGLHGIKEGVNAIAQNLTQDQYDGLQKSEKLTDLEKTKLKAARDTRFNSTLVKVSVKLPDGTSKKDKDGNDEKEEMTVAARTLRDMKPSDVAALKGNVIAKEEVLNALSGSQLAALDLEKFSDDENRRIKERVAVMHASKDEKIQKESRAFHSIVGVREIGSEKTKAGSNPNASRRWAGYLPETHTAAVPPPPPAAPAEPYVHVPFSQRPR